MMTSQRPSSVTTPSYSPLGMLRPKVDQGVGRLRRAEAMVEELVVEVQRLELGPLLRLLVAAVEKALAVLGPGGLR